MGGRKPTFYLAQNQRILVAVDLEKIRAAAERVAASHGMDVVEIDYVAAGKQRALRVFVEKNAAERARLAAAAKRGLEHSEQASQTEVDEEILSRVPASVANGAVSIDQLAWVTHRDCEQFSTDFGTLLDVEDLVPGAAYTLEVSSPGLDRKLTSPADYERFRGSQVKIRTFEPVAGNRHWQGHLKQVLENRIKLDVAVGKKKGRDRQTANEEVELELSNIERANLVPEI